MELQLGLALSTNPYKGFEPNKCVHKPKEKVGSEKWSHGCCLGKDSNKKRSFNDAFEMNSPVTQTLPLLLWNDKPDDDDDRKSLEKKSSCSINKGDGEGDGIVGWPPIKSWRKKLHYRLSYFT